jgi:hypothetical protein
MENAIKKPAGPRGHFAAGVLSDLFKMNSGHHSPLPGMVVMMVPSGDGSCHKRRV